jgi:phosphatidate cytidylyltransferase
MLGKRIASSLILIGILSLSLIYNWLFALVVCLIVAGGLYEFFSMLEKKGIVIFKYCGIAIGTIIPLSVLLRFELTKGWELFFIVLACLTLILMQFRRKEHEGVVVGISTTVFGILYVAWFLSFLAKIKYLPNGTWLLLMLLLITKLGDIGAYLVGARFGKTPLIPRVSPKKSVEGAFAGLVFSILGALASKAFVPYSYFHLAFLGGFLGVLGQLGDLSESLMKRDCQLKDSSSLLPGLGGILDLMDSLIFTAPVFYFYMSIILLKN